MLGKAAEIRKLLTDETAQAHADAQIREYQNNLEYLVGELQKITVESDSIDVGHTQSRDEGSGSCRSTTARRNQKDQQQQQQQHPQSACSSADSSIASAAAAFSSAHYSTVPSQTSGDRLTPTEGDLFSDSRRRTSLGKWKSRHSLYRTSL